MDKPLKPEYIFATAGILISKDIEGKPHYISIEQERYLVAFLPL